MANAIGRPTLLTDEVRGIILRVISMGNYRCVAARAAGISPVTLEHWMMRGKREQGTIYADFAQAIAKVESAVESGCVARILELGKEDPKHLEWYLERKYPKRWGRRAAKLKPSPAPPSVLAGEFGQPQDGPVASGAAPSGATTASPRGDLFARIDALAEEIQAAAEREVQEEREQEDREGNSGNGGGE